MYNASVRKDEMPAVIQELEAVRAKNARGLLMPVEVVDHARDKRSPIHGYFEWDDTEAAELYRQEQARSLIRVVVAVIDGANEPVTAYVRLSSDNPGGQGYRHIVDVLSDEQMTAQLISDALGDLDRWRDRYMRVKELGELRSAIEREAAALKKTRRQSKRSRSRVAQEAVASPIPG